MTVTKPNFAFKRPRFLRATLVTLSVFFTSISPVLSTADGPDMLSVRNVARNDVLNIREAPDHRSPIVGTIPFDAKTIVNRGCGHRESWCEVEFKEAIGFANGQFLQESSVSYIAYPFSSEQIRRLTLQPGTQVFDWFGANKTGMQLNGESSILALNRCQSTETALGIVRTMCEISFQLDGSISKGWIFATDVITSNISTRTAPISPSYPSSSDPDITSSETARNSISNEPPDAISIGGPMGDYALGSPNAPVTVYEYTSMTCYHCAAFHLQSFSEIMEKYVETGKVRWVIRAFPFDPAATAAVMLARCSGENRYYKFLDVLFEQQPQWAFSGNPGENLEAIAKHGGFSAEAYNTCIQNEEVFEHVSDVQTRAQEIHGVRSTPTFFVNGEKVEGALPFDDFEEILLRHLPERVFNSHYNQDVTPEINQNSVSTPAPNESQVPSFQQLGEAEPQIESPQQPTTAENAPPNVRQSWPNNLLSFLAVGGTLWLTIVTVRWLRMRSKPQIVISVAFLFLVFVVSLAAWNRPDSVDMSTEFGDNLGHDFWADVSNLEENEFVQYPIIFEMKSAGGSKEFTYSKVEIFRDRLVFHVNSSNNEAMAREPTGLWNVELPSETIADCKLVQKLNIKLSDGTLSHERVTSEGAARAFVRQQSNVSAVDFIQWKFCVSAGALHITGRALMEIFPENSAYQTLKELGKCLANSHFGGCVLLSQTDFENNPDYVFGPRDAEVPFAGENRGGSYGLTLANAPTEVTLRQHAEELATFRNSDEYKMCSGAQLTHIFGMNACRAGASNSEVASHAGQPGQLNARFYGFVRHNLINACNAERAWPDSVGTPNKEYTQMCVEYVQGRSNNKDALPLLQNERQERAPSPPAGNTLSHFMCESYIGLVQQGLRMCRDGIPMSIVNDMASSLMSDDRRLYAYVIASWRKGCGGNEQVARQLQSGYWREDCAAFINGR